MDAIAFWVEAMESTIGEHVPALVEQLGSILPKADLHVQEKIIEVMGVLARNGQQAFLPYVEKLLMLISDLLNKFGKLLLTQVVN